MRLLLNQTPIEVANPSADVTLLQWLRECQYLTATKEGCAVGDCGACTVMIGRLVNDGIVYQSVNACIALLGSLNACHVVTLDGLQAEPLHPVQQAMVDCHASQCGFCSPGFVMSLLVWWLNTPVQELTTPADFASHRHGVELALSGNLCRCTGYQPILLAADQLAPVDRSTDPLFSALGGYSYCLDTLRAMSTEQHHGRLNAYQRPQDLNQLALAYAAMPEARLVAGATDLALDITQGLKSFEHLIDIKSVAQLQAIDEHSGGLTIGAAVSLSQLETYCQAKLPCMTALLGRFASRQVRNRGTLVGNIANSSPIADTPPLLLVLDAQLILQRGQNQRTLALADFYLDYKKTALEAGEFIHSVILPLPTVPQQVFVEKVSKRAEDDISSTCVALSVTLNNGVIAQINIACGGMAAIPKMASHTQSQLLGQAIEPSVLAQVPQWLAQDYQPIDDMRASADYRQQVTANLIVGFLKQAMA